MAAGSCSVPVPTTGCALERGPGPAGRQEAARPPSGPVRQGRRCARHRAPAAAIAAPPFQALTIQDVRSQDHPPRASHLGRSLVVSPPCLDQAVQPNDAAEQEHSRRNSEQRSSDITVADHPGEPARQRHKQDAQIRSATHQVRRRRPVACRRWSSCPASANPDLCRLWVIYHRRHQAEHLADAQRTYPSRASSRVISWNKESEAGRLIHADHPAGFIVSLERATRGPGDGLRPRLALSAGGSSGSRGGRPRSAPARVRSRAGAAVRVEA